MALKIIGTGLGRTGTTSLKLALEQLGYGKCYHMSELFRNPEGLKYFMDAENGNNSNWDSLLAGYQSAIDYPVARYYKQLIARYPDAKVIHTVREPESWYNSCVKTIFWASKPDAGRILNMIVRLPFSKTIRKRFPVLKYAGYLMDHEFGKDLKNKKAIIEVLAKREEEIKKLVPEDRLLIYNIKDGWTPLCKFLNVPVPDAPFPVANTKDDFLASVKALSKGKRIEHF